MCQGSLQQLLQRQLDANLRGVLHVMPVCGLLDVVCMPFDRVVECGLAKCA